MSLTLLTFVYIFLATDAEVYYENVELKTVCIFSAKADSVLQVDATSHRIIVDSHHP